MSIGCSISHDKRVERQKFSFAAKLGGSEIGNWKWNPSATMLAGLMNRSDADGI